jgi:hypothetical protein
VEITCRLPQTDDRRIVARQPLGIRRAAPREARDHRRQRPSAQLRTAPAARRGTRHFPRNPGRGVGWVPFRQRHRGQVAQFLHEPRIDPVLPAPERRTGERQAPLLGHGDLSAHGHELQEILLRPERPALPPCQIGREVVRARTGAARTA